MAVEVLAGTVITHRCPWVGVARRDLDVAQAYPSIEHGRHERVPEHVRVHPRHPNLGGGGQMLEPAGGRVPVRAAAEHVAQDRTVVAVADGPVDGSADRWRQRDKDDFAALAPHSQNAVAVLLAEIADAGTAGLEDPQPEQAKERDEREVVRILRQPGGGDQRLELQVTQAERRRLSWDGRPADVISQ